MTKLTINETSARSWSKMGPRATYGMALLDLVERNSNIVVASADLGNSSGLDRLKKSFPERFIDTGIAEQNLLGIAAGIAKEGFTVFVSSFAPFITMRACEQMRLNMGYMELDIKSVGIGSGLAMNFLGNSHFGLEDVSVVRSIPNIQIVSPADCGEIVKMVHAISESGKPTYLRLTGTPNMPIIYSNEYRFELGKFDFLSSGEDVTIVATGSMVHTALRISERVAIHGIRCGVVNCHTINPIDGNALVQLASNTQKIVALEEHFESGGLGSSLLETLNSKNLNTPLMRIGLRKQFSSTGSYDFMLRESNLDVDSLVSQISTFVRI